jgi:hypothetical protein
VEADGQEEWDGTIEFKPAPTHIHLAPVLLGGGIPSLKASSDLVSNLPAHSAAARSRTTTAVSRGAPCSPVVQVLVDFAPALPQPFTLPARCAALLSTSRLIPPPSSTTASGSACRFSHQAGSAAPQAVHRPSRRGWAVLVVAEDHAPGLASSPARRGEPQSAIFSRRGDRTPLRPPPARTILRCTCQAVRMNHRGGRRAFPPGMSPSFRGRPDDSAPCRGSGVPETRHREGAGCGHWLTRLRQRRPKQQNGMGVRARLTTLRDGPTPSLSIGADRLMHATPQGIAE